MAGLILKAPYYKPGSKSKGGASRGGIADYIATRDGVELLRSGMANYVNERKGSNGMFTDAGEDINMAAIEREIDEHKGNVWTLIFSLSREDAERLGYNSAEQWMNLLRSHRNDIAREMRIRPENLRWYAAFHQKEEHPHCHVLVWSTDPKEAYLTVDGIRAIKKTFAHDIFRQDSMEIYQNQTYVRDALKKSFRDRMEEILDSIREEPYADPEMELLLMNLRMRLSEHKGKKVYGYLPKETKKIVDAVVKKIAAYPPLAELYDRWYEYQCDTFRLFTDKMPEKIPMEENKEFKSVRNMVVKLASEYVLAEPLNDFEEVQEIYAKGKKQFENGQRTGGLLHLEEAALCDPWCAVQLALLYQYQLHDTEACRNHLRLAAGQGYRPAEEILRRIDAGQSAYILGNLSSLLYHAGRVFADEVDEEFGPLVPAPYNGIDSKIRREQWAKDHGVNLTMG
ncbi:MAG: hypothetical protein IKQ92_12520 [Clostridia bacterium]|nr:hypothetical protein [Clostridia bacterium]